MKTSKFLPLAAALALAACGEKTPPSAESSTAATAPAVPASATAPAPGTTPATSATAPAASNEASSPASASASSPASAPASASAAAPSSSVAKTAGAGDLATGEKVYTATCLACHGAGVMGAPKFGDKAAWAPRIAKGKEALYTNALNGFKMMPPKGGNASLKDEELKAAVDYMVSKSS